jgi:hypothetical protein
MLHTIKAVIGYARHTVKLKSMAVTGEGDSVWLARDASEGSYNENK